MAKTNPLYEGLMKAIEYHRVRQGLSMVVLEERAGLSEGYFSKMLHADSAEGRRASWQVLERVASALWPDGRCTVKVSAQGPGSMLPGATIKATNRAFQTYLRRYFIAMGQRGAKARNERLTPQQRSEAARRANLTRQKKRREAAKPTEAPAPRTKPARWGVGSTPMTRDRHATRDLTF
jgi:hypothetical protein